MQNSSFTLLTNPVLTTQSYTKNTGFNQNHLLLLQKNVIIIGTGASGLAAARQLQNFGTRVVTVFLTIWTLPVTNILFKNLLLSLL